MIYTKGMREAEKARLFKEWSWALLDENKKPILKNEYEAEQMALLLDNVKDEMIKRGDLLLTEGPMTTSGISIPTYQPTDNVVPKVLFSLVRGSIPQGKAKELVSLQTIKQPKGALIFYINWLYGNDKGNVPANGYFNGRPEGLSWQPQPSDRTSGNKFIGHSAWYSSEKVGPIKIRVQKIGAGATNFTVTTPRDTTGGAGNATVFGQGTNGGYPQPFGFITAAEVIKSNSKKVFIFGPGGRRIPGVQILADGGITGAYTTGDISLEIIEIAPGGAFYLKANSTDSNEGSNAAALYTAFGGTSADANGTYYDGTVLVSFDQEGTTKIPEMKFDIKSISIDVEEDKMKLSWTQEAKDDYNNYMGLDPENELIKITTAEMTYNLDRRLLNFILSECVVEDMYFTYDWEADVLNNTTGNYLDRHQSLMQKINTVSGMIYERNRIESANWIVVSPRVATLLATLHGDKLPTLQPSKAIAIGSIDDAGVLPGTNMRVFVDPNWPVDLILFGRKGSSSPYDNGVVYSPYTSWLSPIIYDPNNATPVRFIFNRFGINKIPFGELNYAVMTIDNLPG